ncbi:MAG: hypothetical protein K2L72_01900 [Clostridia bacterium]|nr:hypothetical protein [Clostridia bacterium]
MVSYSREQVAALTAKRRGLAISMAAVGAVGVAVCAALCFIADRNNSAVVTAVNCLISVLCGWYIFGCLFGALLPIKARIAHIKRLLSVGQTEICGIVESCGKRVIVSRYVSAIEVTVSDGESRVFYLQEDSCPFNEGDEVRLSVRRNFICGYGVNTDEN